MVALLISEKIQVKAHSGTYCVSFIDNIKDIIGDEIGKDAFIICDSKVWDIYGAEWKHLIDDKQLITIKAKEETKTLAGVEKLINELVKRRLRRNSKIVVIGGGITQDISSFVASIVYRGVDWEYIPTTLLSQADSCIGSKTSINIGEVKNLVGGFYPAKHIYIDVKFLESLNADDIRSGIGEILHYFFYSNSSLVNTLKDEYHSLFDDRKMLARYVKESLKIKSSVIELDEFDRNERNKFNYGHTFGHGIESISGFSIPHGSAVTIGMDIANFISLKRGILNEDQFVEMKKILLLNMPPYRLREADVDRYVAALSRDKKNIGQKLRCVLTRGLGELVMESIEIDSNLSNIIVEYCRLNKYCH